jgi:hypothetical protein
MRKVIIAVVAMAALSFAAFALGGSSNSSGNVNRACFYVDHRGGNTYLDVSINRNLSRQKVCIVGKRGLRGLRGTQGLRGPKGDSALGTVGARGATGPAGPQGAPGTNGTSPHLQRLDGDFSGTNATVATSLDGVQFGPYPDGGAWGGSVLYSGANGLTLADIGQLSYNINHSSADDSPISTPYLRIFLEGDHDVIFDPTMCATVVPDEDTFQTFNVVGSDVRYDDDSCDGVPPDQQSWDDVVAAHGDEVITSIGVTTGFAGGAPLSAILRTFTINGVTSTFGSE